MKELGALLERVGLPVDDSLGALALGDGGLVQGEAKKIEPGKRPLSSMSPTIVSRDGKTVMVVGTPGGSRIITMVLLGMLGYDAGLGAQEVAALPRYHHQWWPDVVGAESGAFTPEVAAQLRAKGHTLSLPGENVSGRPSSHVWGNLQNVLWDRRGNVLGAGPDPRNPVGSGRVRAVAAEGEARAAPASP